MKKILLLGLSVILLVFCAAPLNVLPAAGDGGISVVVDGTALSFDVPPVIEGGRTMVPVRAIFEALGLTVDWDEATGKITGTKDGKEIEMYIDNTTATVDGKSVTLDAPPVIQDGRTLVPVRFIAESTGAQVDWDEATQTVTVTSPVATSSAPEATFTPVTNPNASIEIYGINPPVAGNFPQSLFKYPYKEGTTTALPYTQTLDWAPAIPETFEKDTQYTATLTLTPVDAGFSFDGDGVGDIIDPPSAGVTGMSADTTGGVMTITINFDKTASADAAPVMLFGEDFNGDSIDTSKWALCPESNRQGRSSWNDDMTSVSGGLLHLKFVRDEEKGKSVSPDKENLWSNWISGGAIRNRSKDGSQVMFQNGFGYWEAREKLPQVSGMWGAFWLMSQTTFLTTDDGVDGTEIDIEESIKNPVEGFDSALHWNGYGQFHKSNVSGTITPPKINNINIYDGDFHTFGLDWTPSEYIFYVDGVESWRCDGGPNFKNSGINRNPNYIMLSVEGSNGAGALPADFTEGEMLVDYVKVYNQPRAAVYAQ